MSFMAHYPQALQLLDDFFELAMTRARGPGHFVATDLTQLGMDLSQSDTTGVQWVAEQASALGWIDLKFQTNGGVKYRLTHTGWQEAARRRRLGEPSRAFMALKFGQPDLDRLITEVCKPAAESCALKLVDALDAARAGLIDDIMRTEIRRARLVLVELTHGCRGSYWEGGFAEALNKPTIYLCRRNEWENERTHFDTEHLHTIIWDPDNLSAACARLTASMQQSLDVMTA
jgi:hypothetical protein